MYCFNIKYFPIIINGAKVQKTFWFSAIRECDSLLKHRRKMNRS